MPSRRHVHEFAAAALSQSGLSRLARRTRRGEACVLSFHGLCEGAGDNRLLDQSLHLPVAVFRKVCRHLAAAYRVMPLRELADLLKRRLPLPDRALALTFDDGYASNFHLAYPVLREFGLPATIFVTTGFVDETVQLWFQRLDLALSMTRLPRLRCTLNDRTLDLPLAARVERQDALQTSLAWVKALPEAKAIAVVDQIEHELEITSVPAEQLPAPMQPLTWPQIRDMANSGLMEFGAHTHSHPILARCSAERARQEIITSRDRLAEELGSAPALFSFPNGRCGDYTRETQQLLREAGFAAAFTMEPGFLCVGSDAFALPRCGAPASVAEAEATVSGAFETLKHWRNRCRAAFAE